MNAIDLFAGPGGWDLAAGSLDLRPLGIEFDPAACATREAAGHSTEQADIAELDPAEYGPCDLLIASPPCQAWSMAGNRLGEKDRPLVYQAVARIVADEGYGDLAAACEDPRSMLVVEPLRWAKALRPRFIACEQVPAVLDLWRHFGEALAVDGYGWWAGMLSAERYGVPQTRKRAILMAVLDGQPQPPAPTHQAFKSGEPPQHEFTLEGELLPWVSMAEALGWAGTETIRTGKNSMKHSRDREDMVPFEVPSTRPAPTVDTQGTWKHGHEHIDPPHRWKVGFPRRDDTGSSEDGYRERDFRDEDEPAFAVTEKARSAIRVNTGRDWKEGGTREDAQTFDPEEQPAPAVDGKGRWHVVDTGNTRGGTRKEGRGRSGDEPSVPLTSRADQMERRVMRANAQENAAVRDAGEPAPTITGGHDTGDRVWTAERPATNVNADPRIFPPEYRGGRKDYERGIVKRASGAVSDAEPLPPQEERLGDSEDETWPHERPASTVWTDPRVPGPGHKKDKASPDSPGRMEHAVRVTEQEAAVLQGFPPDYPFQGTRTKRFEQIGNAIPPPLARAILEALIRA